MRVLAQVEHAAFDVPTGTFTIQLRDGAERTPVLAAIGALGYEPELLDGPPEHARRIDRLDAPTSTGVREGLVQARARGAPLLVALGGPFCRLCRLFEETTLEDERVRAALAAGAFLQVDVELEPAAARDFNVHGVPDFWLLDAEGRVVARVNAYLDPDEFLAVLGLTRD